MSIAVLQNAPWLDVNCKSVTCNTLNAQLAPWATGDIDFLGTNIAGGITVPYSITNNIVTLNFQIPSTEATESATITFANDLPSNAIPSANRYVGMYFCGDSDDLGHSQQCYCQISDTGAVQITLLDNATAGESYFFECIVQYSL